MTADANLLFVEPNGEAAATHSLDSNGWRVIRTASVADAMERAKHDHPSAVIFRGALAEGVTLAKKLRCNARTALLPWSGMNRSRARSAFFLCPVPPRRVRESYPSGPGALEEAELRAAPSGAGGMPVHRTVAT